MQKVRARARYSPYPETQYGEASGVVGYGRQVHVTLTVDLEGCLKQLQSCVFGHPALLDGNGKCCDQLGGLRREALQFDAV